MHSLLEKKRLEYKPQIPEVLKDLSKISLVPKKRKKRAAENLEKLFPKTFDLPPFELVKGMARGKKVIAGVVFSGGPAAGGHNVVAGIWDAIKTFDKESKLIGFLNGPSGIIENQHKELSGKEIDSVRNLGGFDLLGSGRTKIETPEQMEAALKTCQELALDGLVVIGGDDSNTNAAILAEFFLERGCKTQVIGVPKTIDGDLRSDEVELSFGFDSATKTYSELIGNIQRDVVSSKKYYHFIKLMGRSASHITLECALSTHPNLAFIGEEGKSLVETVKEVADLICKRKAVGKEYGVILIPEGLVEFFPEMKSLICEINSGKTIDTIGEVNRKFLKSLPEKIQSQLLLDRDPHGNISVSQIETEKLLIELVEKELKNRADFKGKFFAQEHFFGYEGRCCFPSNFDANYGYALGRLAALGLRDGATGGIASIQNLAKGPSEWKMKISSLIDMIHLEVRKGKEKPVIQKALVDLEGKAFAEFKKMRKAWEMEDCYRYPGPIQFFGDFELTDSIPLTLKL